MKIETIEKKENAVALSCELVNGRFSLEHSGDNEFEVWDMKHPPTGQPKRLATFVDRNTAILFLETHDCD